MDPSGKIVNTNRAVLVFLRCHKCNRPVDQLIPWRGHEQCLLDDDGLFVNLDIENYETRGD